eukprot:56141-Amorphochlora_amoeboformis.AAC.1
MHPDIIALLSFAPHSRTLALSLSRILISHSSHSHRPFYSKVVRRSRKCASRFDFFQSTVLRVRVTVG